VGRFTVTGMARFKRAEATKVNIAQVAQVADLTVHHLSRIAMVTADALMDIAKELNEFAAEAAAATSIGKHPIVDGEVHDVRETSPVGAVADSRSR